MTTRLKVGPFNRVEGDLEVTLELRDGVVASAEVTAPMFRGFEVILQGKDPLDALVFVPRICGICSVSQTAAAAAALAQAMGLRAPDNGRLAANLVLAAENLADHLTHFYLFFMPDFTRPCYAAQAWSGEVQARFAATRGTAARAALAARSAFLQLMGQLAGKWPHTLALQPGGSSQPVDVAGRLRLLAQLRQFRAFLEQQMFGDRLEQVGALASEEALAAWSERVGPAASDFGLFLRMARSLPLHRLGRGADRFLSHGAFPQLDERPLWPAGLRDAGGLHAVDDADIDEALGHSWLRGDTPQHPFDGRTEPEPDKAGAYTWCKAPRWRAQVAQTGALARQVVAGDPLLGGWVQREGAHVLNRVVARALELARLLPCMEQWAEALRPGQPFCVQGVLPDEARAAGRVEAARGALGHWLRIEGGRIASYQIVAPTTWNFSPRDDAGTPGPLEQALVGTPVPDGDTTAVQHVVRSFDPCMVCTVH